MSAAATTTRIDSSELFKHVANLVPQLAQDKYKGQAGKIAVIGGCREYTGAPFFAAYSALKVGADLAHVFCTPGAATVIKTYSPELIVHPYLPDIGDMVLENQGSGAESQPSPTHRLVQNAVDAVGAWLERFDVLVIGPGLGRDEAVLQTVSSIMQEARKREIPLVIDADGLWIVNNNPGLVQGYSKAVLTPNAAEFRRLVAKLGTEEEGAQDAVEKVARHLNGPVVVRKGSEDVISDGAVTVECREQGSLRRAGGQGDVLSGTIAAYIAWSVHSDIDFKTLPISPLVLAAYGGCFTVRRASKRAFAEHGRAMGAVDIMSQLGRTIDQEIAPSGAVNI